MQFNPLSVWLFFLLLTLLARRDRRSLARAPFVGFVGLGALVLLYLAWRLLLGPGPRPDADALVGQAALALAGGLAMPLLSTWLPALLRQDLPRITRWLKRERGWLAACALLTLLVTGVYFLFGTRLAARGVFETYDTLFGSDPKRYTHVLDGMAGHFDQVAHKHPLYPLLGNALFRIAALFVGVDWAPLAVSSAAGGFCAALAALYFRRITDSRALGLLMALLLAATASHVVFSALPETYTLSAASLILLHLLLALGGSAAVRFRHQVLAAVLSAGVTITNAAPALVCFASQLAFRRRLAVRCKRGPAPSRPQPTAPKTRAREVPVPSCNRLPGRILRWAVCVLLVGSVFLAAQNFLNPEAAKELTAERLVGETRYFSESLALWQRLGNLGRGLWLENVVGPSTTVTTFDEQPIVHTGPYQGLMTWLTLAAWLLLSAIGVLALRRVRLHQSPTLRAALICLGLAAVVHFFYGNEHLFLYSCSFTFYVLAILAHALPHLPRRATLIVIAVFTALLILNNAGFAARILQTLDQVPLR